MTTTSKLHQRFTTWAAALNASFPERSTVIAGILHAVLTGQHVLLLGLPGTAKSLLTRTVGTGLGGSWWELLFTRFTTPEEVFGPVSLKGLEHDRFERVTVGKLPGADFAFCDEIFKANSAILNALLTAINERIFHNGTTPMRLPLRTVFGASNELPEGKDLEALWDRFVLRFDVAYLQRDEHMRKMLLAPEPSAVPTFCLADLTAAQAEVAAVKLTDATVDALLAVRAALRNDGIVVSDRRWKACLKLTQASAWLAGAVETSPEDLMCLVDALWREPKERSKVARLVGQVADPTSARAVEVLDAAREAASKAAGISTSDRAAYGAAAARGLDELKAMLRSLKETEAKASARGKAVVADVRAEVTALHDDLVRNISSNLGLRSM